MYTHTQTSEGGGINRRRRVGGARELYMYARTPHIHRDGKGQESYPRPPARADRDIEASEGRTTAPVLRRRWMWFTWGALYLGRARALARTALVGCCSSGLFDSQWKGMRGHGDGGGPNPAGRNP